MLGYHYTTLESYTKIQQYGLRPYAITNPDLQYWIKPKQKGIWLWKKKPRSKNHLGNIIRCVAHHNKTQVVLLEVQYEACEVLIPKYYKDMSIMHSGNIEKFVYHKHFPATIIFRPIPYQRIRIIGQYDLVRLIASVDQQSYTEQV